ncbi:MAG: hypothetical protein QOI48_1902 [Solirubrobacteraceae bacterium]|nr:hypothetical protein [Solirubrobacteraceae bacterium]
MAARQELFTTAFLTELSETGWDVDAPRADRRCYYGPDRLREWIEPDLWLAARRSGEPLTLLAEFNVAPESLEHNVANYLWWSSNQPPFWESPAVLVSAFASTKPADYRLHQTVCRFLGGLLEQAAPGIQHVIVDARGGPPGRAAELTLAERAVQQPLAS